MLYLAPVVDRFGLPGHETVFATVVLTVLLSIVPHGVSAAPLARWRGGYSAGGHC